MPTEAVPLERPRSPGESFAAFTPLALQGFCGVLAVAQRVLCERRRWRSREQFVEILAIGQVLPGPNVRNVALMIGDRFFGLRGAFAALAGMMAVPLAIVLALNALYAQLAGLAAVAAALKGMGAVAAGMIVGTALKLAPALRTSALGLPVSAGELAARLVWRTRIHLLWLIGAGAVAGALGWA